jgi:hypothetical protein
MCQMPRLCLRFEVRPANNRVSASSMVWERRAIWPLSEPSAKSATQRDFRVPVGSTLPKFVRSQNSRRHNRRRETE